MSTPLILIVACIYAWVGLTQFRLGQTGWALVWFSYAMANVGMVIAMRQTQ